MKPKILLTLIFAVSMQFCFSQNEWAPVGAKWYYNEPSSTFLNCVTFDSVQDTIIEGYNCKIIEVKLNNSTLIGEEYLKQSGDSIFYYNYYSGSFHLLYDLSANAGDTINVHITKFKPTKAFFSYDDSITDFRYKIIAIDSIQLSGEWIKRQKISSLNEGDWGFPSGLSDYYILDKIGSLTYFFGKSSITIPEFVTSLLRCYTDTGLAYTNPDWGYDCDIIGISERQEKTDIIIYPIPFKNQFTINSTELIEWLEIYDITGLKVISLFPNKLNTNIDLSEYNQGIYLLKAKSKDKDRIYINKLIKQ
jgi:hypothetical protein